MTAGIPTSVAPDELDRAIDSRGALLVDFWAEWCGPCHAVKPVLAELAAEHASTLRVVDVDVATFPEVGERFDVQTLPTIIFFVDGHVQARFVGAPTKRQLVRALHVVMETPP